MSVILRLVLLAEIALYIASAIWCRMVITLPWMVSLGAALLIPFALRAALVATTFSIAFKQSTEMGSVRDWLRAFVFETLAPMAFISIYGPFDKWLLKDSKGPMPTSRSKPMVLLVHGYVSNRGIWWRYVRSFKKRGHYVAAIDLHPALGSIDGFVEQLQQAIVQHQKLSESSRTVLIAHSMGGLVCRGWQAKYGSENVELIVTIGSPHNGTKLAPLALGQCARQMRELSPWHRDLRAKESDAARAKVTSIRSIQDNVVVPNASSVLGGASNVSFAGVGHFTATTDKRIRQYVLQLVDQI